MKNEAARSKVPNVKFAIPFVLLGLSLIATGHNDVRTGRSAKPRQAPEVAVRRQANAPLQIVSVKSESTTLTTPLLELTIVNRSTKSITAYAIRYDVVTGLSTSNGLERSVAASRASILPSGQSTKIDVGAGQTYPDGINKILVFVDFVEFEDGSTWGPDTHRSAERLAGQRAGAHATARHLRNILTADGPGAVLQEINANTLDVPQPDDRSDQWAEGFKIGIAYIQARVRQSYKDGGVSAIESALRQPIDASDRGRVQ